MLGSSVFGLFPLTGTLPILHPVILAIGCIAHICTKRYFTTDALPGRLTGSWPQECQVRLTSVSNGMHDG